LQGFIRVPLTEAELAQRALTALAPYFHFHLEHWGTHPTGKRLRIDAIAVPRNPAEWSRPDMALGIEFKSSTESRPRKENAKIISQCIDYSFTSWDGFGQAPVFFCPGFPEIRIRQERSGTYFERRQTWQQGYEDGIGYLMAAVLGQNNVGELIYNGHFGWAFLMHGSHRIWSQKLGPHKAGVGVGKHAKLRRAVGSR